MNAKDIDAMNKEAQQTYACNCTKNKNKPTSFVCIKCGKCYHFSCISKIKTSYHLIGNLISCCELEIKDVKYYEQEIKLLNKEIFSLNDKLQEEKINSKSYANQSISLLEEINDLHKKNNDKIQLDNLQKELNHALDKINILTEENATLLETISKIKSDNDDINDNDDIEKNEMTIHKECEVNIVLKDEIVILKDLVKTKEDLNINMKKLLDSYQDKNMIENKLLKDTNIMLSEKNKTLQEIIDSNKSNTLNNNKSNITYAEIAKSDKLTNIPGIVIQLNNCYDSNETKKALKQGLNPADYNIKVNSVTTLAKGKLLIKCYSQEDSTKLQQNLANIFKEKIYITEEKLARPKVKIIGDCEDLSLEELQTTIIEKNFNSLENPVIDILHKKRTKRNNAWIIFAEVDKDTYDVIANKKSIYIGWTCCKVYDDFNIMRCYKCCQFGHTSKVCNLEEICHICAKTHNKDTPCEQKSQIKCINCISYNKNCGTNVRVDHTASNVTYCTVYKQFKKSSIKKIGYNTSPLLN